MNSLPTDSEAAVSPDSAIDSSIHTEHDPSLDKAGPVPAAADAGWGWTAGHRWALALLLTVLLGFMIVGAVRRPVLRGGPAVLIPDAGTALEARIDPNTADVAALMEIPGLGRAKAQALVDYREKQSTGGIFRRALDLERVPGWGAKSAQDFGAYMAFPGGTAQGSGLIPPARLPSVDPDE